MGESLEELGFYLAQTVKENRAAIKEINERCYKEIKDKMVRAGEIDTKIESLKKDMYYKGGIWALIAGLISALTVFVIWYVKLH